MNRVIIGHVLDALKMLGDDSVHLCVTSPPYWGLRSYDCPPVVWGDNNCDHEWGAETQKPKVNIPQERPDLPNPPSSWGTRDVTAKPGSGQFCARCGAWRGQLGLEPTPELYVEHLVEIFREVKRVLRPDGVCFLNLGDSYASSSVSSGLSCGTFDKVPEDCPLRDCPWSRPCDGCQAAPVLRTFRSGSAPFAEQGDDLPGPNPVRKESGRDRSPTSRSSSRRRIPQSSDAIRGQGQNDGPAPEQPCVSRASTHDASSPVFQRNVSTRRRGADDPSESPTFYCDAPACEHRTADTCGKVRLSSSSAHHTPGNNHNACPYLHYSTAFRQSQLKPKDLVGIPWRVAFALQADGWYLRSDIIWAKPNPMPESVTDRPTKAHEYLFLLTKSGKYFYDADAVREPNTAATIERAKYHWCNPDTKAAAYQELKGINRDEDYPINPAGRNLRSVWTITTRGYPEAHFATFPPEIPAKCIKTSPTKICLECGAGWERVVEKGELVSSGPNKLAHKPRSGSGSDHLHRQDAPPDEYGDLPRRETKTLGFRPTCSCEGETGRAVILDMFGGRGTTAQAALDLGRDFIHIDIGYPELAEKTLGLYCPEVEVCEPESILTRR